MDPQTDFLTMRPPTTDKPLMGVTLLLVEDSRFACEAVRLMCQRSGARLRRAATIAQARHHLRTYRPGVVIVDLGLPDGDGEALIADLAGTAPRVEVILATSGDPDGAMRAAVAGADGFLPKPLGSLAVFQHAILDHLPKERRPSGLRLVPSDPLQPDRLAYHDDLVHAAEVLATGRDERTIDYVTQFLQGVARSAEDDDLTRAVDDVASTRRNGGAILAPLSRMIGLMQSRLTPSARAGLQ